jgi:Amt family ammonium transporter
MIFLPEHVSFVPPGCFFLILLVPLVLAGLGIMNTGLGRTRSAAHFMVSVLMTLAVAAIVYAMFGFSWEGIAGGHAHQFYLDGKVWDWIGHEPYFLHGLRYDGAVAGMAVLLQIFTVGIAAIIPLCAGADRWRLPASLISTALLAGLVYPLFAHWVWGGGWLSQLGAMFGLGAGFLDPGGAAVIHVVGGAAALAMAWILGPRYAKYSAEGTSAAIPGYNIVYVLFGCMLMLPGWIALNGAAAMIFAGVSPATLPLIATNTILSASAAGLAAMATTAARFTKPDASLCASGWVGGLVTSSALCAYVGPGTSILTGLVAGAGVTLAIEALEVHLGVDDPGGAISAHGIAGIWGLFCAGVFARVPCGYSGVYRNCHPAGQFMAQLVGVMTLTGFVLPLLYILNWLLNKIFPQRVDRQGELLGMDLRELGGGAYPEFVVRTDEHNWR